MQYSVIDALANPIRLKLITCLSRGKKNVAELIGTCGLAQSAVSQHLTKLKNAGLVIDEKKGKYVYYSLIHKKAVKIARDITSFAMEVEE